MATGIIRRLLARRRLKWAGLGLSILLGVGCLVSGKYVAKGGLTLNTGGVDSVSISITRGGAVFEIGQSLREPGYDKLVWLGWRAHESFRLNTKPKAWVLNSSGALPSYGYLSIPLWVPFLLVFPWTALAWWKERVPPPGRCRKCRYDLAGLESTICPECGTSALSEPEMERLYKRTRWIEAVLIGLVAGGLAGWGARMLYLENGFWLPLAIGLLGGCLIGVAWGRSLDQCIRRVFRVMRNAKQ